MASPAKKFINHTIKYLSRPLRFLKEYDRGELVPDIQAGLTVAVILLPQAIAFALIAELPPAMGLYTAIVAAIVGALWGSSNHIHTGPTTAISLLVMSALVTAAEPGTSEYIIAAGLLAVMAGIFQMVLGFARLGVLINFVSESVVTGFATGAAFLIGIKELRYLFGLDISGDSFMQTVIGIFTNITNLEPVSTAIGVGVIAVIVGLRIYNDKYPGELIAMVLASVVVFIFSLQNTGLNVVGEIPSGLPPLKSLPFFNYELLMELSTGALAVGAIGLVETSSIARSIATQTGQRLDSNQEFIGQGFANIAAGFFGGYPAAGSFSRSAVTFDSGAKSAMAVVFSSLFVLIAVLTLGSLVAYLPRTALAGVLVVTAYKLIHTEQIMRILRGTWGDSLIMAVTFFGTLLLHIEFAVLAGIFMSFVVYIMRTSTPQVKSVLPDRQFRHFIHQPDKPACPQLGILSVLGDLYFGAATHVEQEIQQYKAEHPEQKYLLLRMYSVDTCDFSGIHMLERVVKDYREDGGDVFMMRVSKPVRKFMLTTGFYKYLGADHFLSDDKAISYIFHRILDPAICIYECNTRAFLECQNLPKYSYPEDIDLHTDIPENRENYVDPKNLWEDIHENDAPKIIDVREPREFKRSHIPGARPFPLSSFLSHYSDLSKEDELVLVCRGGRRSARAASVLRKNGYTNLAVLEGGMQNWEQEGLLTAVEEPTKKKPPDNSHQ